MNDEIPLMLEREAGMAEHVPPVAVGFGLHPIKNGLKSKKAGYDVFDEQLFIKVAIPGDRNSLYLQPASPEHQRRFPRAYDAYQRREHTHVEEGMPIENWAPISRATALTLRSLHIHTVEALAAVHEGHIDRLPQGRELQGKAKAWLESATSSAALMAAAKEKQDLQDQISALQAQINAIQERSVDAQQESSSEENYGGNRPRLEPARRKRSS